MSIIGMSMARFHAALRKTWKQGAQPRVSTGQSIHAVLSITRSPREGIEDVPRLRVRTRPNRAGRAHDDPRAGLRDARPQPGQAAFTSGYFTLRGSNDIRDLVNVSPQSGGGAFRWWGRDANMVVNGNLPYRGALVVVACPRGSTRTLTLSDQPNVRKASADMLGPSDSRRALERNAFPRQMGGPVALIGLMSEQAEALTRPQSPHKPDLGQGEPPGRAFSLAAGGPQ